MRTLSRHMPPAPDRTLGVLGWTIIAVVIAGLGLLFPPFLIGIGAIAVITCVAGILNARRLRRLAEERNGESICEFARSFERRDADPWVIRAVHESLQPYLLGRETTFPIRASDRLNEDVQIDPEDLDDLAREIAERTGHDLTNSEENPLYDRVETVGDFVMFLSHQPESRDAQPDECTLSTGAAEA